MTKPVIGRRELPPQFFSDFKRNSTEKAGKSESMQKVMPVVEAHQAGKEQEQGQRDLKREQARNQQQKAEGLAAISDRDRAKMLEGLEGFSAADAERSQQASELTGRDDKGDVRASQRVDKPLQYKQTAAGMSGVLGGPRIRRDQALQAKKEQYAGNESEGRVEDEGSVEAAIAKSTEIKTQIQTMLENGELGDRISGQFDQFFLAVDAALQNQNPLTQKELGLSLAQVMFKRDVVAALGATREDLKALSVTLKKG